MNFMFFLGLEHGFRWLYVESKTFSMFFLMYFNTNPRAKPTPLAVLPLKPLLKAREKPCKLLALDGFGLNSN